MTSVQFLTSHVRSTLGSNAFEPNQENKVLPVCQTPKQDDDEAISKMSVEEKTEEVLSDPKFGMFSLLAYHWYQGHKNAVLKRRNTVYCSHIFSSLFALPFLIFLTQWVMFIAVISHQVRTYDSGICPQEAELEEKLLMASVSMFYFIKSFFLYDGIVDRTKRTKMMPTAGYIVMLDTFQEFGFNILVYLTNLWVIFADKDFLNMFFNTLAMEFLMEMDNEFERAYFSYLPGVAVDIYDNMFVTYRENHIMIAQKKQESKCFRCCRRLTWLPFKLLIFLFMILPLICFVFIFYGGICK
tara:strand:+ start:4882 stop:5775 length:894 start_codon:yes stop_codon:yes gene_type:complete